MELIRLYYEDFLSRFNELPIAYYVSRRTKADTTSPLWYKQHVHQEFEVLYLESGEGVIRVNQKPLGIKSGDLILIPPFVSHEATANYDIPLSEYCICFDLSMLRGADPTLAALPMDENTFCGIVSAQEPIAAEAAGHLLQIIRACQEHPPEWTIAVRGHMLIMFSLFFARFHPMGGFAADSTDDFYRRVIDYISRHYAEATTSRTAAKDLCYSQSYFCRRFKRDFGVCFNEYLCSYRLNKARNLLILEKHSVTDVAALVGFSSAGYFTQCFQKRFHMLPSSYCG